MTGQRKRKLVERAVRARSKAAKDAAVRIHELAEAPFHEAESAHCLAEFLAAAGFSVDFEFPKVPTAFRAECGKGGPVVGVLGEYDALPDCGLEPGSWGHGCGHNLLGAGAAAGAAAAAAALRETGAPGRVVFYGCPAEEALAGKVYMARDGAFRDMDVCLGWHPGGGTRVNGAGGSALDSMVYEFFGRTAHGAHPAGGRSALDGAILFDVAVNYLREHVPENVRIHSVIPDGGRAPNVVPAYAKIWYYIRGQDRAQVDEVRRRMNACAQGAAIATDTRYEATRLTAIYSRLPNDALASGLLANIKLFGLPRRPGGMSGTGRRRSRRKLEFDRVINEEPGTQGRASSDEDNVSWLAPFGCFTMMCCPKGLRGHHRETTAHTAEPPALAGMLQAAKVFAGTALDLCADKNLYRRIRTEFRRGTKGFVYKALVPKSMTVMKWDRLTG